MKKNLVLIGMPGSGKSTLGRELAAMLHMMLLDTDAMVEQSAGRPIPRIFAEDGEEAFRDMETAQVKKAAAMEGVIIATGGGVILRPENMQALSASGIVMFRDRDLAEIMGCDLADRPLLSGDAGRIYELYHQRIHLYRQYADHTFEGTGTAKQIAGRMAAIYRQECNL